MGFPGSSAGKESTCNAGDPDSIPGLGRSPGKVNGFLLQYSGLENSMDCIVHGITKSQTWQWISLSYRYINSNTNYMKQIILAFSSVQLLSHVQLFMTPWTVAHQASLSITNSRSLLRLMSIELVMPSNHLIPCPPLLLLPSIFPSSRVFSNESVLHIKWPKYWSVSFCISPSNEYSGLISFRMDWLDLLEVQGILKSLLQYHSSKASILWYSALHSPTLTPIYDYWKIHSLD